VARHWALLKANCAGPAPRKTLEANDPKNQGCPAPFQHHLERDQPTTLRAKAEASGNTLKELENSVSCDPVPANFPVRHHKPDRRPPSEGDQLRLDLDDIENSPPEQPCTSPFFTLEQMLA